MFLRAPASLPRFEDRSSARLWLLSVARRTVVDGFRHDAARPCASTGRTGAAPPSRTSRTTSRASRRASPSTGGAP
ncbi:hypothetical protein [Streptomyces anthocyanicus]|uniref:hypothetical protein n=1 Tax=Streptomyces anthocyanicus TaxID=68174 RepID=UPI0038120BBE